MSDEEYKTDMDWLMHEHTLKEYTSNQKLERLDVCSRVGEGALIHPDKPFPCPVSLHTVGLKRFAESYSDVMLQRSTCPVCRRHISLKNGAATNGSETDSVV